jgi:thiol:disulfide interchange protein DsbC
MQTTNTFFATLFARRGLALVLAGTSLGLGAQEAAIRKNLAERLPEFKAIESVTKLPVAGWYEVRINGTDIYYTDAKGDFLMQGNLVNTQTKKNLTREKLDKLMAIKFEDLPRKDAFTIVRGNGQRKIAVFEDPDCGFCKRFEKDFEGIDNVTVSVYLYPILGSESKEKSKRIWCAKDRTQAWRDWMLNQVNLTGGVMPCDTTALDRNLAFGQRYRIEGTPTLFLADGRRVPGAQDAKQVEKLLSEVQ